MNLSGNLELMHELNTKHILRVIRQFAPISRSEIVEKSNLTAATVSRIVSKLIKFRLVRESGFGESKGGRKPVLLELIPDSILTIGLDIEIDEITAVIIDLEGKILLYKEQVLVGKKDEEYILRQVNLLIKELLNVEEYRNKVIGIGIGIHGLVDSIKGVSIFPPAFDWENFSLAKIVSKSFSLPVILENNVRALTLGESWFGLARNLSNFISLKVGSGIGSGIFTNGQLYRGTSNSSGEIGHTMVDEDGPLCTCGNYGCLESVASIPAIIRRSKKALKQGQSTMINDLIAKDIEKLSPGIILAAADKGDNLSQQILKETGHYLGIAVANYINILNPEAVIISGNELISGEIVLDTLRSTVENRALAYPLKHLKIINSSLGGKGVAIGAATLILESVFNVDNNVIVDIGL
ncbi:ROK family protein [Natronospora cellulosivora (SeqCode)]